MINDSNRMFSVCLKFGATMKSWESQYGTVLSNAFKAIAPKLSKLIEEFYKMKKSSFSKNEIHARAIKIM